MVSIPADQFLVIGLSVVFVLAVVLILLARDWIRERFKRNMPKTTPGRDVFRGHYPPMPLPIPPPPALSYTPEEERAQVVEANAWSFLLRHAPHLTPAEAFEKAEAWQKIIEKRGSMDEAGYRERPAGKEKT